MTMGTDLTWFKTLGPTEQETHCPLVRWCYVAFLRGLTSAQHQWSHHDSVVLKHFMNDCLKLAVHLWWNTTFINVLSQDFIKLYNMQKNPKNGGPYSPSDNICAYVHTREQPLWPLTYAPLTPDLCPLPWVSAVPSSLGRASQLS